MLAFAQHPDGTGKLEPLSAFTANPAAAIVNAVGPIRQIVGGGDAGARRFVRGTPDKLRQPVQLQVP